MKKKFVTNLILLLGLNILIKPFWVFGIDRTVQNVVGAADYGLYFSLFSFSLILNIFLDFGITNFNNREISRNPGTLSVNISNIIGLKVLLSALYIIVSFIIALLIGYDKIQFRLLIFLMINQVLASFLLYLRSNISGLQMFKTDSFLSVLDRLVMIILCALLLWTGIAGGEFKIEWFVYVQGVAYSFALLVALIIVLFKARFFRPRFRLVFIKRILRKSYPFALLTILMSVYYRVDSVMLERMLTGGETQAGIYAQAFRILDAFSMFAFLFATLLLPMFSKMIKNKTPVEELTVFSFFLLIVPVIIVSISLIFFRHDFMNALYHEHALESSKILAVLMLAHIFVSATYISGTLLTAGGHLKALNVTSGIGLGLNVILNAILIPDFYALGSAYASLFTQALMVGIQFIILINIYSFGGLKSQFLKLLVFIFFVVLLGWLSTFINTSWLLKLSVVMMVSMIIALLMKLIRINVFSMIFRGEEP